MPEPKNLHVKEQKMESVVFKVRNKNGGYNIGGIRITKEGSSGCQIRLLPAEGKYFVDPVDIHYLLGLDEIKVFLPRHEGDVERYFPIVVNGVSVYCNGDDLCLNFRDKRNDYAQTIAFFEGFTTFEKVLTYEPGH